MARRHREALGDGAPRQCGAATEGEGSLAVVVDHDVIRRQAVWAHRDRDPAALD